MRSSDNRVRPVEQTSEHAFAYAPNANAHQACQAAMRLTPHPPADLDQAAAVQGCRDTYYNFNH
jgi:hypothetical protein